MATELTRREKYEAHLASPHWQVQRLAAFAHWGRFCGCCGVDDATNVHHLNYRDLVDCVPEDFMPLCDACHEKVHAIPELDRMARVFGDPMHKRRMVLLRMREAARAPTQVVRVIVPAAVPKETPLNRANGMRLKKLLKMQLKRERKLAIDDQRQINRARSLRQNQYRQLLVEQAASIEAHPTVIEILCSRFRVSAEAFAGWPKTSVNAVLNREAIPIFARPETAREIAATSPDEMMTLTAADVTAMRTSANAFTRYTLEALGMKWNELKAGWPQRLVGTTMPRAQYLRAVAGKNIYAQAAKAIAL